MLEKYLDETLLSTNVTWADIQRDVKNVFGEEAEFGPNRAFVSSVAEGHSSITLVGILYPDWVNPVKAPERLAIKIFTLSELRRYEEKLEESGIMLKNDEYSKAKTEQWLSRLHNVEVTLYRKLNSFSHKIPVPKVYATREIRSLEDPKGYLIMECVDGVQNIDMDYEASPEVFDKIMRGLAELHASTAEFTESEKQELKIGVVTDVFSRRLDPNFLAGLMRYYHTFLGEEHDDLYKQVIRIAMQMGQKETMHKLDSCCEYLGMDRVICHGDPWTCNYLFTEVNGKIDMKYIVDLQVSHFGCVGHDLGRLFCSLLSTEERRLNWRAHIATYYGYLKNVWKEDRMPFSLEQLELSYLWFLPFCAFFYSGTMTIVGEGISERRKNSEETKNYLQRKALSLMEDVVRQQKENLALFSELEQCQV